jgi:thiamine transporter ThiT
VVDDHNTTTSEGVAELAGLRTVLHVASTLLLTKDVILGLYCIGIMVLAFRRGGRANVLAIDAGEGLQVSHA